MKHTRKRVWGALLCLAMLLSLLPVTALADGDPNVINIENSKQLVEAIKNQKNGQTWVLAAGDYDVKTSDEGKAGGYDATINEHAGPFAFPIYVDGLTIKTAPGAEGKVTITSSADVNTGAWNWQNFITVSGSNVTIQDVNLRANHNEWYKDPVEGYYGTCNKAIEICGDASDFTLQRVNLLPVEGTKNGQTVQNSGSIYFNTTDAGDSLIEDVTMYSFISGRHQAGQVTVKRVEQNYTNNNWAQVPGYTYGVSDRDDGTVSVEDLTIIVDNKSNLSEQVFADCIYDGTTIELAPGEYDVTVTRTGKGTYGSGMIIDKNNITLKAADPENKPVLYGFSNEFNAGVDNYGVNGQDTIYVSGENVTLENLKIMPLGGIGENANNWQKTVEVTSGANGFTMTGCETLPNIMEKDGNTSSMHTSAGNIHVSIDDAEISGNSFGEGTTISAGWTGATAAEGTYSVDVSGNYWGEGVTAADIADKLDGNVKVDNYYTDEDMAQPPVQVGGTPVTSEDQLLKAIEAAKDGGTIVLAGDIELTKMLSIDNDNITLNLNGYTITAAEGFTGSNENSKHLVTVYGENISIKNGTLKTTVANKHVLNVYGAQNFKIENVILDHTNAFKGAPMVVNGSTVTVAGTLKTITGENSWYAINVDNVVNNVATPSALTFAPYANIVFDGVSNLGISMETSLEGQNVSVEFDPNVNITAPDGFVVVYKGETQKADTAVVDPENAGLVMDENGVFVEAPVLPPFTGHSVAVVTDGNGTVTVNPAVANAGQIVTITATPKEGYKVGTITVTSALGQNISVVGNQFTMPAASVTVKVTFVKADRVNPFTDVVEGSWYYEGVMYVYENGLMNGTGDGTTFSPAMNLNRAMLMTILARMDGVDTTGGDTRYSKGLEWAVENGISDGTNPDADITREQMVTMLYRYMGSPAVSGDLSAFADGDSTSDWAKDAVIWAVQKGLLQGNDGKLNPTGNATRMEVATILMRFCENVLK